MSEINIPLSAQFDIDFEKYSFSSNSAFTEAFLQDGNGSKIWEKVNGNDNIIGGCIIDAKQDHRIAMSFNILSLITKKPILVIGNNSIKTSFPNFFELLSSLGAKVKKKDD